MNKNSIIGIVAFAAFAVVMLGVGIMKYQNAQEFKSATATITKIEEVYTGAGDDGYDYEVYVRFSVNGIKFDAILDSYNASMKIGDKVDIIYNPETPTEVQTAGASAYIIPFVVGIASAVGAIVCIVKQTGKKIGE